MGGVRIRKALQVLSGTVSRCATEDLKRAGFFAFMSLRSQWSLRACRLALKGFFYLSPAETSRPLVALASLAEDRFNQAEPPE